MAEVRTIDDARIQDLEVIRIKAPTPREKWTLRILIFLGLAAMGNFVLYLADPDHIGYAPLYWLLNFTIGFKLLQSLHEWYHYYSMSVPPRPVSERAWTVDMVTTFCPGEPYEMIVETLKAMKAVRYPHETYLCDEGNDPYIKQVCEELGVHHVYRGKDKKNAKAGNVNYALEHHCKGEIVAILDPDHVPVPEFLDRALPYFEDPQLGYVQCIQAYYNRNESFVAKGAAEQTYQFYGPMMMSMNSYGTAQAIGANCTFRRSALDSIGGHAPGLAEDMHTAMQLHAKGWKSVYIPEILTKGLVPATMSAYYKQQIKWSRGVFELLFRTFPQLWRKLTLHQFLHYFILPFYYLYGLVGLIDISVPIISLTTSQVPWHVDLLEFAIMLIPLFITSMVIRQYSQRWMAEEHERGFHVLGGTLRAGTWWVFLVGFVYSIFNVKVPYIPTPKGDEQTNELRLSIPNIIACVLSLAAIAYGLYIDWNPYSFAMAGFAMTNVIILGFVVLIAQQKALARWYRGLYGKKFRPVRVTWYRFRHRLVYPLMRSGYILFASVLLIALASFGIWYGRPQVVVSRLAFDQVSPYNEGVYTTAYSVAGQHSPVLLAFGNDDKRFAVSPLRISWAAGGFPVQRVRSIQAGGGVPFINWEGNGEAFTLSRLQAGEYDEAMAAFARSIRIVDGPMFINPQWLTGLSVPDSLLGDGHLEAWRRLKQIFHREGAANVAWVWDVQPRIGRAEVQALRETVDWVEVSADPRKPFQEQYSLIRDAALTMDKRVMVHLPGPPSFEWLSAAQTAANSSFPEIQGWVWESGLAAADLAAADTVASTPRPPRPERPYLRKTGEGFELLVDGAPFYIKGIAYHPMPHWYEGGSPLTRRQLELDYRRIKEMGANTIRRYAPGMYDRNVLSIADEFGLKVIFGFVFNPETNYLRDSAAVREYVREVISEVEANKHRSSILGWNLGNETWTTLEHKFRQPYLTEVRFAYLRLINQLAAEIHRIDPGRPVFVSMRYTDDLPASLRAFQRYAPEVDILGINALYEGQIASLDSVMQQWAPGTPYIVSEFGPDGYWEPEGTPRDRWGFLDEPSGFEKAIRYASRWTHHIEPNRGRNLGGVAYSWRDQQEGTATWYGLTDFKSRLNPGYYALKEVWTGTPVQPPLADAYISPADPVWYRRSEQVYRAASENNRNLSLAYNWYLSEEEIAGPQKPFSHIGKGPVAYFQIPDKQKKYRLYLYISDPDGNVVSASRLVNP